MYTVDVEVTGIAPLLQNQFPVPTLEEMSSGGTKKTGATDYSEEWREKLYANGHGVFQPAVHFEASMVKAAVAFRVKGQGRKTYKDLFKSSVFVTPDEILHGVDVPEDLTTDGDEQLYIDMRPVVVQRARVIRMRPTFKSGWKLEFQIEVLDDAIPQSMAQDILAHAGKTVGIGDFRPRMGRFNVTSWQVLS